MSETKRFLAIRDIAEQLHEPVHRVRYAVRNGPVESDVVVGHTPGFSAEKVEKIREKIETDRRVGTNKRH